jgi:AcrR family transcriptional regulator
VSGKNETSREVERDPRLERTREALVGAFSSLVQERRYDEIRVHDVALDAGVGRSTFYEHFRGKDDLLLESMNGIFGVLARAIDGREDPALEHVLAHFWDVRPQARYFFTGPPAQDTGARIVRELARRIELRLAALPGRPMIAGPLLALQVAESELALVRGWLAGIGEATPAELAAAIRRTTAAIVASAYA